jgi:hypothetical protein
MKLGKLTQLDIHRQIWKQLRTKTKKQVDFRILHYISEGITVPIARQTAQQLTEHITKKIVQKNVVKHE